MLAAAWFISWFGAGSVSALYGYASAMLLILVSQWCFLRRAIPKQADRDGGGSIWDKRILAYSWPFGAWGIFSWAQGASDRWALQYFADTIDVGLFAVLYQLGFYPIAYATGTAVQFIAPILFQRAGDGSNESRVAGAVQLGWRMTLLALSITGIAFVIAYQVHDVLWELLVADDYRSVSHFLPWMLLAGGIFASGQTVTLNLMSQMRTHSLLPLKVGTAVIGVALNVLAAKSYGVTGVVYASVISAAIYLLWAMAISRITQQRY
jgi:O-antigen/teichoic acid export membrane protein